MSIYEFSWLKTSPYFKSTQETPKCNSCMDVVMHKDSDVKA